MPTNTSRSRPGAGRRSSKQQTRSQFLGRGQSGRAQSGRGGAGGRSFGRGQAAGGQRARPKGFGGRPNPGRKPSPGRGRRSPAKSGGGLGGLLSKLPSSGGKSGFGLGKSSKGKGKGAPAAALLAAGAGALLGGRKLKQRRSGPDTPDYGTENVSSVNENPTSATAPTPSPMTPPGSST